MQSSESPSLRIFVVENHADTLKYLQMYLEQMGHTVVSASTMNEALETLPTSNCEVLLSDIGLPDGTGWELLKRVRANQLKYAVAMSGFGMASDFLKSKDAGYRRHITKPLDPNELDSILEEAAREVAVH